MSLSPEEKTHRDNYSKLTTEIMSSAAKSLATFALNNVEIGCGTVQIFALRSKQTPKFAALCVVASGCYTDADISAFKAFVEGGWQDATSGTGASVHRMSNIDNTQKGED